jgi:hypothetical protein
VQRSNVHHSMKGLNAPARDFCGDRLRVGSAWSFPCRTHELPQVAPQQVASEGNWAACDACRGLIIAGKRDRLARRAEKKLPPVVRHTVRPTHDSFWANRSGPPRRLTAAEVRQPPEPPRFEKRKGD